MAALIYIYLGGTMASHAVSDVTVETETGQDLGALTMAATALGLTAVFALVSAMKPHPVDWWHEALAALTAVGALAAGLAAFGQFVRGLRRDGLFEGPAAWLLRHRRPRPPRSRPGKRRWRSKSSEHRG